MVKDDQEEKDGSIIINYFYMDYCQFARIKCYPDDCSAENQAYLKSEQDKQVQDAHVVNTLKKYVNCAQERLEKLSAAG